MKLTPNKIEEIREAAKQFAIIFGVIAIVLFLAGRIFMIWEYLEWCLMAAFITTYTGYGLLIFCVISLVVMLIIDQKKKDDKNKERINELETTVQELQAKREQARKESPLTNLTEEQQSAIEDFLLELPIHKSKEEAINMKEWARFIRALEELNYISPAKSADTKGIREWVILLADGRSVPNSSAFNQALRDATPTNIDNAIETLKKILKTE